jgi:hypothetical protein
LPFLAALMSDWHDAGVPGHAVQGDFDLPHGRVDGRLAEEPEHVVVRLVGKVQQHVAAVHVVEQRRVPVEPSYRRGGSGGDAKAVPNGLGSFCKSLRLW